MIKSTRNHRWKRVLFDPNEDNQQLKGAFNNYVDTLVVKSYIIEQIQSRLKISKSLSTQFVNKLNGNQILILSKNLNDFIKYVDDNHNNINDYILMSSFNNLQKDYNITQQQEKNKEVIRDNQQETGEICTRKYTSRWIRSWGRSRRRSGQRTSRRTRRPSTTSTTKRRKRN